MVLNIFLMTLLVLGGVVAVLPPSYVCIPLSYDKILHVFYCFISIIFLDNIFPDSLVQKEFIVCLVVFVLGVLAEVIQGLLPYRHFSKGDIIANTIGIFFGYVAINFSNII